MNKWERFNESFYSNLNMENIDDIDYRHGNNVFKIFNLKNLGEYHDLYVQSDTLLLADVFENFRNKCLLEIRFCSFLIVTRISLASLSKENEHKIRIINRLRHAIDGRRRNKRWNMSFYTRYAKANNKYMNNYDENEESSYIQYLDANNIDGWAMSQKLPVNNFKWIEDTSKINEDLIKNYYENSKKGYILEVYVKYPKNYMIYIAIYHSCREE